jgi:DTW domain-containing protein
MATKTRIVLLMHLNECRHQKSTTGRLLCLHLANSEIIPGMGFDDVPRVRALIDDPANYPVLLYPGENAMRLEDADLTHADLGGRQLVVFLLDATWACARKSLRDSPGLLRLPRIMISPRARSRFVIKRQPHEWCLSTLEAAHELLLALSAAGLDEYPDTHRLLKAFDAMQNVQIEYARKSDNPRRLQRRLVTPAAEEMPDPR